MDDRIEHSFYRHAFSVSPHSCDLAWRSYRPVISGLLGLSGPLRCGDAADAGTNLAGLLLDAPIIHAATRTNPATVDLLIHGGPLEADSEWLDTLAPGALILCLGTSRKALSAASAPHATLDLGAGMSMTLMPGSRFDALASFISLLSGSEQTRDRVATMITVLETRIAHEAQATTRLEALAIQNASQAAKIAELGTVIEHMTQVQIEAARQAQASFTSHLKRRLRKIGLLPRKR